MVGGSEMRCAELANGISQFTPHKAFILAEDGIPSRLRQKIHSNVICVENSFKDPKYFYDSDRIIIVNTDTPEFSTADYWLGKSSRHNLSLDVASLSGKNMFFLYNFLVSPAQHLDQLSQLGVNVNIITTNRKFFEEITKQDRYERVRIFPRYILESPINQYGLDVFTRKFKETISIGMHSKGVQNKWNSELPKLVNDIRSRYSNVLFRFMGIPKNLQNELNKIKGVTCLSEDGESVRDFLKQLDIFLFFPDWKREEPWARVIAEAMVSGCPVIALNKGGTPDQVLHCNNGFLCKNYKDFYKYLVYIIEHKETIESMSKNSIRISQEFYSSNIIRKLMCII